MPHTLYEIAILACPECGQANHWEVEHKPDLGCLMLTCLNCYKCQECYPSQPGGRCLKSERKEALYFVAFTACGRCGKSHLWEFERSVNLQRLMLKCLSCNARYERPVPGVAS